MSIEGTKHWRATKRWLRNASDDKAARNGCVFDEERASYTVWWIERYCRLSEGCDGDPLILRGCRDCPQPSHVLQDWFLDDGETVNPDLLDVLLARAKKRRRRPK
jgi:hypothetical protein